MKTLLLATGASLFLSTPARANDAIEKACLSSGRQAANAELCSCIQRVADQILTASDQRKGAAFFADPHKSQETRQSSNSDDGTFWKNWKDFGEAATKICR